MSTTNDKNPVTMAVRVLREHRVDFTHHPYEYEERGGTEVSARELGVDDRARRHGPAKAASE